MKHQFFGKRYTYGYEIEPIHSSYDLDKRINDPGEYVYSELKSIENVLLREVDYLHSKSDKDNRTVIDNVTCLIERTEVDDGIVKYYTNYTEKTIQPNNDEFEKAKELVVEQATERKYNKDNVYSFADKFNEFNQQIHKSEVQQLK